MIILWYTKSMIFTYIFIFKKELFISTCPLPGNLKNNKINSQLFNI